MIQLKTYYIVTLIALSLFGISSCKKYPDGPSFSLKTKEARLANKWVYEVNLFFDSGFGPKFFSHEFSKKGIYIFEVEKDTSSNQFIQGTWEFGKNKSTIITYLPSYTWRKSIYPEKYDTLEIKKLKTNQFWYQSNSQGSVKLIPYTQTK